MQEFCQHLVSKLPHGDKVHGKGTVTTNTNTTNGGGGAHVEVNTSDEDGARVTVHTGDGRNEEHEVVDTAASSDEQEAHHDDHHNDHHNDHLDDHSDIRDDHHEEVEKRDGGGKDHGDDGIDGKGYYDMDGITVPKGLVGFDPQAVKGACKKYVLGHT